MNTTDLASQLRQASFLRDADASIIDQLASIAVPAHFSQDEVIFREGDAANDIYLIVSGRVSIEICSPGKGCRKILSIDPGELLGWSPLLEQSRFFTATARAVLDTDAIQINAAKTLALCDRDPRFGYAIMKRAALAMSKRLSAARLQLLDLY